MGVHLNLLLIFVNILVVVDYVNGQVNVKDDTDQIECVKLSECSRLYNKITNGPFKDEYVPLIKICGLDGTEIKVWCPNIKQRCNTPDGKESTCRTIVECPQFYNATKYLAQEDFITLIPKYTCVTDDGIFRVCCPDYNLTIVRDKPEKDNFISNLPDKTEIPNGNVIPETTVIPSSTDIPDNDRSSEVTTKKMTITDTRNLLPDSNKSLCGRQLNEDRILGGITTDITDFPWMALLMYETRGKSQLVCSGTLINERYVLTAAHCLERRLEQPLKVMLGEYDRKTDPDCVETIDGTVCAPPPQLIKVEERILHPEWVKAEPQFYDDIGLLRLAQKAIFNDYVRPICLPVEVDLENVTQFTIAGWGKTEEGALSDVKKMGDVMRYDDIMCKNIYRYTVNGQLCIGHNVTKVDTCTGDSGGPLMYIRVLNKNVVWFQAGVTSLGYNSPCGRHPALYTYVPRYLEWIYNTIKP